MKGKWYFVASLFLAAASGLAHAESCDQLHAESDHLSLRALAMIRPFPGSTAVFASCLAAGANDYQTSHDTEEAGRTFAGCAAAACLLTENYADCLSVSVKLFAISVQAKMLDDQIAVSCNE